MIDKNMAPFLRGSEWRKWDLHVHTPSSIVQHYGGDTDEVWEKFITDIESLPVYYKAIGINDYIFLDGYKRVLDFKSKGRLKNIDLFLPVLELRIDKFSSVGDEAWKKVNFHVIFSNELDLESIQVQFLYAITSKATVFHTGESIQGVVTRAYLEQLGEQIRSQSDKEITDSLIKIGFNNVTFDYEKVCEALKNSCFRGKFLTAIGKSEWDRMRWDGSAAIKKTIVNDADFLFHSLEKPEDYQKHIDALRIKKVNDRLLDCSDAHYFSETNQKDRIGSSYLWLKADLTFDGLKQVANDNARIFVGELPPLLQRYKSNTGRFIDKLQIKKLEDSTLDEVWFSDFELPLNPSMVAIIGNKGNGKSALAETIGLVGDTLNSGYFTFLSNRKFRNKKTINRSENFQATLFWADGKTDSKTLDEDPDDFSYEKVKFIPQGFLEKLCNDDSEEFESELRKVIYSHLPMSDRLGKPSLDELIAFQTEMVLSNIVEIQNSISEINKEIESIETKGNPDYKKILEERLKEKQRELEIHDANKPVPVEAPDDPKIVASNSAINENIAKCQQELSLLNESILAQEASQKALKIKEVNLKKVLEAIEGFKTQHQRLRTEVDAILQPYELKVEDFIKVSIGTTQLEQLIEKVNADITAIEYQLGTPQQRGDYFTRQSLTKRLSDLSKQLDAPSKEYHDYILALKEWEASRLSITGTSDIENTIAYFNEELRYISSDLAVDLEDAKERRVELVTSLYEKKLGLLSVYKNLFKPVTDFIENYRAILEDYTINLSVEFKVKDFQERFLDFLNLGTKGSFSGNPTGFDRVTEILAFTDFSCLSGILDFLKEVDLNLHFDKRTNYGDEARDVSKQLRKGYSSSDLYDYLFGLDYIVPEYKLKLGEKNLGDLSPGERGALLLIFYLTLDQSEIPLIIDQPEENLDNQSVYKILVKFIKEAKEKRQIVIVTHNPNLAVASGAEQIVHISIDKVAKNTVHYASGSLESHRINDSVIDILEGTFPALTSRTDTYGIIDRNRT
jgi:ABC-type lipoprotein export system ATPase subunit